MASSSSLFALYEWFQEVLFESFTHGCSSHKLAEEYGITCYRIRNAYIKRLSVTNDATPTSAEQICLKVNKPGRPKVFSDHEEHAIAEMERMYASNNTPQRPVSLTLKHLKFRRSHSTADGKSASVTAAYPKNVPAVLLTA